MNYCTIHQRVDSAGRPFVQGSEVRLPDGSVIPGVKSVEVTANPSWGDMQWKVVIELTATFGEPIL